MNLYRNTLPEIQSFISTCDTVLIYHQNIENTRYVVLWVKEIKWVDKILLFLRSVGTS